MTATYELKKLRHEKHITVDMVVFRSGIPRDEYIQIEQGRKIPSEVETRKIAVALGVSPQDIK